MNTLFKNLIILTSAAIASIGTYPYAKNFASHFSSGEVLFASTVCVVSALTANIALGVFSILDTLKLYRNTSFHRFIVIGSIAVLASMATGFICAVGYYDSLPLRLNVLISLMVTCVNAAISYSALHHASHHIPSQTLSHPGFFKTFLILLTMFCAFIASLVFYLATVNGLLSIFKYYHLSEASQKPIAYVFSILVWLPGAALFINASRVTISEFYDMCSRKEFSWSLMSFSTVIIALFSGSAFSQMTFEFFDSTKHIPDIFRFIASSEGLVTYFLMPITFIISALVNAYALSNVLRILKGQNRTI